MLIIKGSELLQSLGKISETENLRNGIISLIKYCDLVLNDKNLFYEFDTDEINIHKMFIFDKLESYTYILEMYLKSQLEKEYDCFKLILNEVEFENMCNLYIMNDFQISESIDMLCKMKDTFNNTT